MGLLDRGRRKQTLSEGIEGTAKIVDLETKHRFSGSRGESQAEPWLWESMYDSVAPTKYRLELEVTVPGRDPYRVRGEFRAPNKAERTGLTRTSLSRGLELPVRVDPGDSDRVEIDWDRFAALPDRKKALGDARVSRQNEVIKQKLEGHPKQQAQMWEGNRMAVQAWAGAVKAENMSREEFEETVRLEVDSGRMDPADAEAARKTLDG